MELLREEKIALAYLREDARIPLTRLSKQCNMPVSTLFDRLSARFAKVVEKFTALVNFSAFGYTARAFVILKVKKEDRIPLREYLEKQACLNSLYKINNGFDFMVEVVFRTMDELEQFSDRLEDQFSLLHKELYYVISDIHRERFLAVPERVKMMESGRNMVRFGKVYNPPQESERYGNNENSPQSNRLARPRT